MSTDARTTATLLLQKGELKQKIEKLAEMEETMVNGQKYLIEMSRDILMLEKEVEGLNVVDDDLVAKIQADMEDIRNHPIVVSSHLENELLVVETDWFVAHTQRGTSVPIPPLTVSLNLLSSELRAECINSEDGVKGYWTRKDPHPHVNGSNGKPCLGEAGCAITELISSQEYYAGMLMCLEYLQNVNEGDSAGENYTRWIDKHGNKLDEIE